IKAAETVVGDTNDETPPSNAILRIAAALVDKSLLLRADSAGHPLYRMLETVRAYAALALAESGEADAAAECLVEYCLDEAGLAPDALLGPAQAEWLVRVEDDLENYRRALEWLIERDRSVDAAH